MHHLLGLSSGFWRMPSNAEYLNPNLTNKQLDWGVWLRERSDNFKKFVDSEGVIEWLQSHTKCTWNSFKGLLLENNDVAGDK